jgi:hypothetical protein
MPTKMELVVGLAVVVATQVPTGIQAAAALAHLVKALLVLRKVMLVVKAVAAVKMVVAVKILGTATVILNLMAGCTAADRVKVVIQGRFMVRNEVVVVASVSFGALAVRSPQLALETCKWKTYFLTMLLMG